MIDLTGVIAAVWTLLIAVVIRFVIPSIRSRIRADKLDDVTKWVKIAVEAAEMIYRESGAGEKKKQYVLDFLNGRGCTYDAAEIDCLIEAAVMEMKAAMAE